MSADSILGGRNPTRTSRTRPGRTDDQGLKLDWKTWLSLILSEMSLRNEIQETSLTPTIKRETSQYQSDEVIKEEEDEVDFGSIPTATSSSLSRPLVKREAQGYQVGQCSIKREEEERGPDSVSSLTLAYSSSSTPRRPEGPLDLTDERKIAGLYSLLSLRKTLDPDTSSKKYDLSARDLLCAVERVWNRMSSTGPETTVRIKSFRSSTYTIRDGRAVRVESSSHVCRPKSSNSPYIITVLARGLEVELILKLLEETGTIKQLNADERSELAGRLS